jgi:hypothetical protein
MKKNNSLEDFIRQNRDAFDHQEPSSRVWEGIVSSEQLTQKRNNKRYIPIMLRIAAVAVLIIAVTLVWFRSPDTAVNTQEIYLTEAEKEIINTTYYYETQVQQKQQKVFQLTTEMPDIKEEIEADFEALDKALSELKDDLNDNMANTEVLSAMIQNYRLKLQILEQILEFMEEETSEHDNQSLYDVYSL